LPRRRLKEEERPPVEFLDLAAVGAMAGAWTLAQRLRDGWNVLAMFDAATARPGSRHYMEVSIGTRTLRFHAGVEVLARQTGATVLPVWIQPRGNGYVMTIGSTAGGSAREAVHALVQRALEEPALWEGWFRLPELAA
jgi:lauroyl/myristoyl acyltransferase